ncbi:winged helix-turn-helix domain-containing protein, partial [Streptomyces sp. NPDC006386]|uniref:winged helix-turn-helix domain-containing protein n=1 Tax=Streptomyces sp. NPDC006386 TaxID=3156762 RepID=UPI0033B75C8D
VPVRPEQGDRAGGPVQRARPGRVVPAEELLEHVWDEHADPFTNTVRVTVGSLRRKVTGEGEPLIETVIRQGYRLKETP